MKRMSVESPEVVHELFEFVSSLGQRQHNVNGHVGRLHQLTFHFHEGAEGAEEKQPAELLFLLSAEGQLVQRALVLLSARDACNDEETLKTVKKRNDLPKHPRADTHKPSKISKKSKLKDKYYKDKHITNVQRRKCGRHAHAGVQKPVTNLLKENPEESNILLLSSHLG